MQYSSVTVDNKLIKTSLTERGRVRIEQGVGRKRSRPRGAAGPLSVITGLLLVSLETTVEAGVAAANVANGHIPENSMESYFSNIMKGETAWADMDATMAALESGGYEAGAAMVAWGVLTEMGDFFSGLL